MCKLEKQQMRTLGEWQQPIHSDCRYSRTGPKSIHFVWGGGGVLFETISDFLQVVYFQHDETHVKSHTYNL